MTLDVNKSDSKHHELSADELSKVVGGGKSGGPICPVCHSTNVIFDRRLGKVLHCNNCGYNG